jgi:hypothetical protein
MQRGLLLASLLCAALFTQAQTEKGRLMVGSAHNGIGLGLGDRTQQLQFAVKPSFGRFVKDNLVVGTRFGLGFSRYVNRDIGQRSTAFSIEPAAFARYYVPMEGRIRPFVELEAGAKTTAFSSNGGDWNHMNFVYAQAMGGASFFFSEKASLDLSVGYRRSQMMDAPLGAGSFGRLQGNLGLSFYLDGKSKKRE